MIKTFAFSCACFNIFLVKTEFEANTRNVLTIFFDQTNTQSTRSKFLSRGLAKMAEAEASLKKEFQKQYNSSL